MSGLSEAGPFDTEYSSDENDIASEFINPCLSASVRYDRITGFFASSVFLLTFSALRTFVLQNQGRIRILCSPRVSEKDASHIEFGYSSRKSAGLSEILNAELSDLLSADELSQPARLLAALIASGRLDLRVAEVEVRAERSIKRMFHDKVGLFRDSLGASVGFRGSMNETFLGLSPSGNIESVDVWPSWEDGRDAVRVQNARNRFERIWNGEVDGVTVTRLPDDTIAALEAVADDVGLEEALVALEEGLQQIEGTREGSTLDGIVLRQHQNDALNAWRSNDHRGILRHATGAGKTMSGLFAALDAIDAGLVPLIVVPSVELLSQWAIEMEDALGIPTVLCGGGHTRWRTKNLVRAVVLGNSRYCILTIDDTLKSASFMGQIQGNDNRLFLLVDEVHNAGAPQNRLTLKRINPIWRLGLSATPERAGDPEGTAFLFEYFGGVVHDYGLDQAIRDGVLVPYSYDPFFVHLTNEEQEEWDEASVEIGKLVAMMHGPNPPSWAEGRLNHLRIQRARIAKGAANKIPRAVQIVKQHYTEHDGQKWLIYCDGLDQLRELRSALRDEDIRSWEFHSEMEGDREATLEVFAESGGLMIAIKCLDEGIDIPSATHALILASSRNPREFIQRRGRVLRRSPHKSIAHIRDAIVLPAVGTTASPGNSLVVGELARAMLFLRTSLSPHEVTKLEEKWVEIGYDMAELETLAQSGFEVEVKDDE